MIRFAPDRGKCKGLEVFASDKASKPRCRPADARRPHDPNLWPRVKQVNGLPRGGPGAAAARAAELQGLADAAFDRLLELASQHPSNYIIDACKCVRAARPPDLI
jgi:hypothetical protein